MADGLTRPERARAFDEARRLSDRVKADGGCCYCTRRAGLFATVGRRACCGLSPPRQFPVCVTEDPGFELDPPSLPRRVLA